MLGPDHPDAGTVRHAQARATADFALERAKRHLAAGRYREAADDIATAHGHYRTPKLALARLAMRGAPGIVRRMYLSR